MTKFRAQTRFHSTYSYRNVKQFSYSRGHGRNIQNEEITVPISIGSSINRISTFEQANLPWLFQSRDIHSVQSNYQSTYVLQSYFHKRRYLCPLVRRTKVCRVISRIRVKRAHTRLLPPSPPLFKSSNRIHASILEINDSHDRVTGRRLRAAKNIITALFIAIIKGYFRKIGAVVGSSSAINGEKREWWKQRWASVEIRRDPDCQLQSGQHCKEQPLLLLGRVSGVWTW